MTRVALFAIALSLASLSCTKPQPLGGVVLITLDTTRADHLGCYGYAKGKTPRLDALAAQGVRFANATSAVPTTTASHATVFTGLYPPHHGVRYNGMFRLPDAATTIAEVLRGAGWQTAAVASSYPAAKLTGLAQGFDTYEDLFDVPAGAAKPALTTERRAEDVTRAGIAWLAKRDPKTPFLLWLHYFDAHWPYEPPFPYSSTLREAPYDGEIAYVDQSVGAFLDALDRQGLASSTLVVVFGDHGEGLYDHGEKMHSNLVYESTLNVPLIVRGPGVRRGETVEGAVSLADLAPTILDLAGRTFPGPVDGVSVRAALSGGELPRRDLYFESLAGSLVYGWSPLEGLRRGSRKYIRSSEPELYDLAADPGELSNRYGTDRDVATDLDAALTSFLSAAHGAPEDGAVAAPLDPRALEQLASLGYVGGTVTAEHRGGAAPRRFVHLDATIFAAQDAMMARRDDEALARWREILTEDPANRFALNNAAYTCVRLARYGEAKAYAADLVARYPDYVPGAILLGELWVRETDWPRAVETFRAGVAAAPSDQALRFHLALALLGAGDVTGSLDAADAALAKPGAPAAFHLVKAAALARRGDRQGALGAVQAAAAAGFHDAAMLDGEPLLAPLRDVPGARAALAAAPGAAR